MDLQQQRMECLKMAFELGGKTDPIVSAAQQLFEFVAGKQAQPTTEAPAEPATTPTTSAEEPVANTAPETAVEAPSAEAIAACGTALVLPESGELADAKPSAEAEPQAMPSQPDGGTAAPEAPIEVASEPETHPSEQQATDEAPEQGAAPQRQPDPVQAGEELSADAHEQTATEAASEPQAEAPSEASASPEKEVASGEAALLASAPADDPGTV